MLGTIIVFNDSQNRRATPDEIEYLIKRGWLFINYYSKWSNEEEQGKAFPDLSIEAVNQSIRLINGRVKVAGLCLGGDCDCQIKDNQSPDIVGSFHVPLRARLSHRGRGEWRNEEGNLCASTKR
jgi:hypothetical protein